MCANKMTFRLQHTKARNAKRNPQLTQPAHTVDDV